jgi:hypothetical protein
MNSKQREQKYERDSLVRLCACRLKGHKILTLYPAQFSEKRINHIKRQIFEGKISKYRYTDCIECGSAEFRMRNALRNIETTGLRDYAEGLKMFGVSASDAARGLQQFNKALDDCSKL